MASDEDHRTTVTIPADLYRQILRSLDGAKGRQEVPRNLHPNQFLLLLVERGLAAPPSNPPKRGR